MQDSAQLASPQSVRTTVIKFERGVVKFYDAKKGRCFGYLIVLNDDGSRTKEELFFHQNAGRDVVIHDGSPSFARRSGVRPPGNGDILVFRRTTVEKGDKANAWAYAKEFDRIVQTLQSRESIAEVSDDDGSGLGL